MAQMIEGRLEVKRPTIWTDGKAEVGRVGEENVRRKKIREEKESEKEDAGARTGKKVAKHCVFPMFCGSGGSKSRLAKGAGAEPSGEMRDEKLHPSMRQTVEFHRPNRVSTADRRGCLGWCQS